MEPNRKRKFPYVMGWGSPWGVTLMISECIIKYTGMYGHEVKWGYIIHIYYVIMLNYMMSSLPRSRARRKVVVKHSIKSKNQITSKIY